VKAKTRTVTVCGSRQETVTEGPYAPESFPFVLDYDPFGRRQLTLTEDGKPVDYLKIGMAQELVGSWQRGALSSAGFYDPVKQQFAPATGEGAWLRFNSDGTYSTGEVGYATNDQGCALTGWVYQEGAVSVSGGTLTLTPSEGMARMESSCAPGQPQQASWTDTAKTYVWSFRDRTTAPKLVLIPLDRYQEFIYTPEQ
jgi:hypothetical protein